MTEVIKPTSEKLKKWWDWLDGKKTNIAAGALLIIKVLTLCGVPVPLQALEIIDLLFYSLLGIGLGHKATKNDTVKRNMSTIVQEMKKAFKSKNPKI